MDNLNAKYKLGTADTVMLAVGTLAVDYICTSKSEIVEVTPGGKKVYYTLEDLEKKVQQYGIKKGTFHPGSSLGNFLSQAQAIVSANPSYSPVHLITTLALKDPTTKILLDALDKRGITYSITDFAVENAANPIALLVESKNYTKILSFKDKRMPAVEVETPENGIPGMVMIGAAAGNGLQSKLNAFAYAQKHNLPIAVLTTEGEINLLARNDDHKDVFKKIMKHASFFAANVDEVRKILSAENETNRNFTDRIALAQKLREIYNNDKLDILLSFGSEGSLVLVGNTAVVQKIPKIPFKDIVSTAGAGDSLAGAFVQGVRMKGMDVAGVSWALPRANRAAQNILKYPDAQSGQFTAEQFLEDPPPEYETEIISL